MLFHEALPVFLGLVVQAVEVLDGSLHIRIVVAESLKQRYLIRQPQAHKLARMAVLDEAWRLVESPFLEPLMREGRAFGLGVVIASQFPTDLPTPVAGSTATKLYFSQTNVEQIRDIQRTSAATTAGASTPFVSIIVGSIDTAGVHATGLPAVSVLGRQRMPGGACF